MRKRFREMLAELSLMGVDEQEKLLHARIESWRKEAQEEQVDDILVCGVRIRLG